MGKSHIIPSKSNRHQEEYFFQGHKSIVSSKKNCLSMTCRKDSLYGRKGCFCFSILNNGTQPVNIYPHNLKVYDQDGRAIQIISLEKQLKTADSDHRWNGLLADISSLFEMWSAQDAGKTYKRGTSYGPNGVTVFEGQSNNEYQRRQACDQVAKESVMTRDSLNGYHELVKTGLKKHYFQTVTVFPGKIHSANLEIKLPRALMKRLRYLVFEYDVCQEKHLFYFHIR